MQKLEIAVSGIEKTSDFIFGKVTLTLPPRSLGDRNVIPTVSVAARIAAESGTSFDNVEAGLVDAALAVLRETITLSQAS